MLGDDPPYLSVGTEVSAKYKGAFCEAKIRKVVRSVKCRVTYKQGLGTATVTDEQIKGTLRVGASVEARHNDRKDFIEATITKIQDCSQYTVVFDDGDITTLRRTALCLKSGRHFAESETLDQLPLTHPEHFGNPVIGGRRGRRSRQTQDDSSEDEGSPPRGSHDSGTGGEEKEGLEIEPEIGRVVCVELGDKKKKDNWFPGLVVAPTAQDTVRIRVKDDYLVRSFKDARYYTVPKKEATEFTKDLGNKVENSALKVAVEKAVLFLEKNELPPHWDKDSLFGNSVSSGNSDSDGDIDSDSSDDEPREEKDHFVAQLYKFMDDRGTPINNCPMIGEEDIDLYRLFRAVYKLGGYNRVTNQNQWKVITRRLSFSMQSNPATHNLVKQAYKKFLHSFEDFYRKLGCTMVNHPRGSVRKQRPGRSLIRDKDRNTPIPPQVKTEKEEEEKKVEEEKKEKREVKKEVKEEEPPKPVKKKEKEKEKEREKEKEESESLSGQESDVNVEEEESSSSENSKKAPRYNSLNRGKAKEEKKPKEEKKKVLEKKKVEKKQEKKEEKHEKKEEDTAKTRTKAKDDTVKGKTIVETPELRTPSREPEKKPFAKQRRLTEEEMKKRGRKRKDTDGEKSRATEEQSVDCYKGPVELGDKLRVYYGPNQESKVTYEAKVIDVEDDDVEPLYLVHYTGWNTRYDEWIKSSRIAQNLTQTQGRVKRTKTVSRPPTPGSSGNGKPLKTAVTPVSQTRRRAQSVAPTPGTPTMMKDSKNSDADKDDAESDYLVDYSGWNSGYDDYFKGQNFPQGRVKRKKAFPRPATPGPSSGNGKPLKTAVTPVSQTRRRAQSVAPSPGTSSMLKDSKKEEKDKERSTTPLFGPSLKSPATPATGRLSRATRNAESGIELRRRTRRTSGHTDVTAASESEDTDSYESDATEPEQPRARSKEKEEGNRREAKRRAETKMKMDASEEDEKESIEEPRRGRRLRRNLNKIAEIKSEPESDEEQPKGRDFDLNQIRSELKGFDKAVKMEIIRVEPEVEEDVKPTLEPKPEKLIPLNPEKIEKVEKVEKIEKPEKVEKFDKIDKMEKMKKLEEEKLEKIKRQEEEKLEKIKKQEEEKLEKIKKQEEEKLEKMKRIEEEKQKIEKMKRIEEEKLEKLKKIEDEKNEKLKKIEDEKLKRIEEDKKDPNKTESETKSIDSTEDIYEFKEPEPFEFEVRNKSGDKDKLKRRVFDDTVKSSPKKKQKLSPKETKTEIDADNRKKIVRKPFMRKLDDPPEEGGSNRTLLQSSWKCEEAFDKLCETSYNPPKMIPDEKPNLDLLFTDLPGDDDSAIDDPEDRLIISETETEENLFSYQQEIFPSNDVEMEFKEEKPKMETLIPPIVESKPIITPELKTIPKPLSPKIEPKPPETKLDFPSILPSTPIVPMPISARLPVTSSIEEKLSAAAAFRNKAKDLKKDDDQESSKKSHFKDKEISRKSELTRRMKDEKKLETKIDDSGSKHQKAENEISDEKVGVSKVKEAVKEIERRIESENAQKLELRKFNEQKNLEDKWKKEKIFQDDELEKQKALNIEFTDSTDSSDSERRLIIDNEIEFNEEPKFELKLAPERGIKNQERGANAKNQERGTIVKNVERATIAKNAERGTIVKNAERATIVKNPERGQVNQERTSIIKNQERVANVKSAEKDRPLLKNQDRNIAKSQERPILKSQLKNQDRNVKNLVKPAVKGQERPALKNPERPLLKNQDRAAKSQEPKNVDSKNPEAKIGEMKNQDKNQETIVKNQVSVVKNLERPLMMKNHERGSSLKLNQASALKMSQERSYEKTGVQKHEIDDIKLPIQNQVLRLQQAGLQCKFIRADEEGENLNSLLCEEEIPGSPTPGIDVVDQEVPGTSQATPKAKVPDNSIVLMEMPFASAPTSSPTTTCGTISTLSMSLPQSSGNSLISVPMTMQQQVPIPRQEMPVPIQRQESNEAAPVMDNTPPTTPDSSISNMCESPREEGTAGSSPMSEDNLKQHRDSSEVENDGKMAGLSEDDGSMLNLQGTTSDRPLKQMMKKSMEEMTVPKKRKRNRSQTEVGSNSGKKSPRQSGRGRHGAGSDSDDTSEESNQCSSANSIPANHNMTLTELNSYSSRSPRPTKYNFFVELDPEWDGSQRIAVLQQKLSELRKTYNAVKVELATIERRRKKLKRREREAIKAAKAEMQQACS